MPFLGRDWRSPGEAWVKTSEGWERKKILEYKSSHGQTRFGRNRTAFLEKKRESSYETNSDYSFGSSNKGYLSNSVSSQESQPYCQITLKNTKEVIGFNNISEAIQKLDFRNAVHDIRRFNYICKLLHLLITQNLTTLSGRATQILFAVLEEVARQVASNQQNLHILHMLLNDLRRIIRKYYCWGRPLGSTILWEQHLKTIDRICQLAGDIQIKEPIEDGSCRLSDMPEGILREILLRLSDYKDLMNSSQACDDMKFLIAEQHIWKELCKFHFSREQLQLFFESSQIKCVGVNMDWQLVFHQLRRKYGLKEEYTESLFLCRHCRCLFWKSFGHPCVDPRRSIPSSVDSVDDDNEQSLVSSVPLYVPIPPQAFLSFFSL
ncbi:F-box only protein 25-like [Uloborus diversus]|uniref:F-box only protein 25-like n=1 Tax=Uloborus diversus TaxID=327109 RepID=UPI0024095F93|nr:F-box only protein 25-like [Uloborus diversus]